MLLSLRIWKQLRRNRWCRLPWLLVFAASINLLALLYLIIWHHFAPSHQYVSKTSQTPPSSQVAFVYREFEDYENQIVRSLGAVESKVKDSSFIIIADRKPYPPISLPKTSKAHLVRLDLEPQETLFESRPENAIKAPYILLMPDGVVLKSGEDGIAHMLKHFQSQPAEVKMTVWSIDPHSHLHCTGLQVNLKKWTLNYFTTPSDLCDRVIGQFVVLIRREDFFTLAFPLLRPLPDMLFVQTALRGWKTVIGDRQIFTQAFSLFQDVHSSWKHKTRRNTLLKEAYSTLGIKLVRKTDGEEEWFGCSKESNRCFGTVIHEMPDYLYRGRWTPPCCLRALRITARHVFRVLESQGVRYWLEGGSLLGAARSGDIIPWDYDVDIGVYQDDITKSFHLTSAQNGQHEDEDGFIWEKATEGDFYRVQFSQSNHLHVDLFPFFSRNGTMTKNTWFKTHRQDMEFPEKYLKPLEKLAFVGTEASVPNHWHEFLELKFGQGVVEKPQYPDGNGPH